MSRRHQLASITARLRASFAALITNAGSQLPARSYLISLRVTSGEAITSTVILNEKRSPDDKHRGSSLNINTPRKEWGDALRALISRRYGTDSQGIVCRKKGPPRDEARDNRRKQKKSPAASRGSATRRTARGKLAVPFLSARR